MAKKNVDMLCTLFVSLTCLWTEFFNSLKHGFLILEILTYQVSFSWISFGTKMVSKWLLCQNDSWFLQKTLTAKSQFGPLMTSASFVLGHIFNEVRYVLWSFFVLLNSCTLQKVHFGFWWSQCFMLMCMFIKLVTDSMKIGKAGLQIYWESQDWFLLKSVLRICFSQIKLILILASWEDFELMGK